jgi:glutamate-1-semialdehyde 2,1-aminomutase
MENKTALQNDNAAPVTNMEWNRRLKAIIPHGCSTCSKAPVYLPEEPAVIVRGKGCRIWDADGREFIDFRNSLGPITLGYQFPEIDNAIIAQLKNGISFGHPHPLECEVAELIKSMCLARKKCGS